MSVVMREVPAWPKLAWTAVIDDTGESEVLCGSLVERRDRWFAEAVWDGPFEPKSLAGSDIVFGTGGVRQDAGWLFVSAGTVFDRLCYCRQGDRTIVSNSLAICLAVAGLSLREDYNDYTPDIRTIMHGLDAAKPCLPTTGQDVHLVHYRNLQVSGGQVRLVDKPDTAPDFDSFETYAEFLQAAAGRLGANATDPSRAQPVKLLSSISSGYDSTAASVVARWAGCTDTVTIAESSSLWRGSDSGLPVAEALGMSCREYPLRPRVIPDEVSIWAGEGRPNVVNWAQFEYPQPLCLYFTGVHGEKMWDRVNHDHSDPFVRRDPASLGLCEFRLRAGVFQCPVPFWGVRHSRQLRQVTASPGMQPYWMNRDYDKPIARRLVEEAGVPRKAFGRINKNTSLEVRLHWPLSREAQLDFRDYLRARSIPAYSPGGARLFRLADKIHTLAYKNLARRLGLKRRPKPWDRYATGSWPLKWAIASLRDQYADALADSRGQQVSTCSPQGGNR